MEPEEDGGGGARAAAAPAAELKEGVIRIYVGGLGGNVTDEDLKNTFSLPQLGSVESVEIVRTKGRSFAYLDFVPSSDKGLAKLFSTYNGCKWKGGKLRLEKAKEHYMLRLRREWEEDAKLSSDSHKVDGDVVGDMPFTEKMVKGHNLEHTQLRIFFPKLRKVKSVPWKGTGKHKYSFPRVEVPPFPIHFCDCEEHSRPSDAVNKAFVGEDETGGINEQELNIMTSVMSKLFERENISETAYKEVGISKEASVSRNSVNDVQVDQEAEQISDEDNLVMNMVAGSISDISSADTWEEKSSMGNKDSRAIRSGPLQRMHKNHGKTDAPSNTKRKAAHDFEIIPDQVAQPGSGVLESSYNFVRPRKAIRRASRSMGVDSNFRLSDIPQSNDTEGQMHSKSDSSALPYQENQPDQSSEVKEVNESAKTVCGTQTAETNKGSKGSSFLNRSSWMQLVGNNSSFSISQILPGLNLEKQELPQFKVNDISTSAKSGQVSMEANKGDFTSDASRTQPIPDGSGNSLSGSKPMHASQNQLKLLYGDKSSKEARNLPLGAKQPMQARRNFIVDSGMPETFTFKRCNASRNEWKKAKAALTGKKMKKVNEK